MILNGKTIQTINLYLNLIAQTQQVNISPSTDRLNEKSNWEGGFEFASVQIYAE